MKFIRVLFFFSTFAFNFINVFAKDWLSFGGTGMNNNRNAVGEKKISPSNVNSLEVKFVKILDQNHS